MVIVADWRDRDSLVNSLACVCPDSVPTLSGGLKQTKKLQTHKRLKKFFFLNLKENPLFIRTKLNM